MSTLANAIGSGAGVVVLAVAIVLGQHYKRLPGALHSWIERGLVVIMYCAGSAIAVTQLGTWTVWLLNKFAEPLGGFSAGIPRTALLAGSFVVLAAVVVSLIWEPNMATGMTAAFLPVILGMVPGGFLHQVYLQTVIPGQHFVAVLNSWLGG